MDVEAEILDLKRRVGELESGYAQLTQQAQGDMRDLIAFQQQTGQRFDRIDRQLGLADGRLGSMEREVRGTRADVAGLRKDLPVLVGNLMREVLREEKG
jgi:hypothetical protein